MVTKLFEIRDSATLIPVIAIKPIAENPIENFLIARAGFTSKPSTQSNYVILTHFEKQKATYDPYDWDNRTMVEAHRYLIEHFDELENGEVIDVQFILGETETKKVSERIEFGF